MINLAWLSLQRPVTTWHESQKWSRTKEYWHSPNYCKAGWIQAWFTVNVAMMPRLNHIYEKKKKNKNCAHIVVLLSPAYDPPPAHDSKTKEAFRDSSFQSDLPVKAFKMGKKKKVTSFFILILKLRLCKLFMYASGIRKSWTIFPGAKQEIQSLCG